MHHTVCDGASVEQLIGELVDEYVAAVRGKPAVRYQHQGAGLAEWTGRRLALARVADGPDGPRVLAGPAARRYPVLELPTDRPRPRKAPDQAMTHRFRVDQPLLDRLRELSRDSGVSLFSTLLTALAVVLHRYTGQPDLCVGVPISLRDDANLERTLGPLLNMVAVRLTSTPDSTFRDLLGVTSRAVREAMAHGSVPFERVVDALDLPGVAGATPLFQVMFTHERVAARRWEVAGLRIAAEIVPFPLARNDLVLAVEESELWLECAVEYRTDIFDADRIERLAGHYITVLAAAVATPDRPVAALPLLTAEEHDLIVHSWNDTAAPFPDRVTVAQLFQEQVIRAPGAPAVYSGGEAITYRVLNERANQIAAALTDLGVGPETPVGICLDRSVDAVSALLGVLKAGGAYLPLNPAYPVRRLDALLRDAGCPVVVTSAAVAGRVPAGAVRRLVLDDPASRLDQRPRHDPPARGGPESLAYIIHTSGSTGVPRGVQRCRTAPSSPGSAGCRTATSAPDGWCCTWPRWPSTLPSRRCGDPCSTAARSRCRHRTGRSSTRYATA